MIVTQNQKKIFEMLKFFYFAILSKLFSVTQAYTYTAATAVAKLKHKSNMVSVRAKKWVNRSEKSNVNILNTIQKYLKDSKAFCPIKREKGKIRINAIIP